MFAKSQRAVEKRGKWRKLVVKSSVVPQCVYEVLVEYAVLVGKDQHKPTSENILTNRA